MNDTTSDPASAESQELRKVLDRINSLMGEGEGQAVDPAAEKDIPQLTEVYEGEPLSFIAHAAEEFLAPNDFVTQAAPEPSAMDSASQRARTEVVEALLAEMMPMVQTIIKKAVLQELVNAEHTLGAKLELEILRSLRENLQSRLT